MALITPQEEAIIQYLADGATDTFIYDFLILQVNDPAGSDLNAYITPPDQSANPLTDFVPTDDYTVTGVGNVGGGTVIFDTIPPIGSVVTLMRNMQIAITTQFSDAQTFNGASLDNAFRRIVLILQQMQGNYTINAGAVGSISRCLQYVVDTYLPTQANNILPLLTNIDNQVWMSQGGNIAAVQLEENPDVSGLRAQLESETAGADGTNIIGYFNENAQVAGTLCDYLNTENIYGSDTGAVNALVIALATTTHFTAYRKGMVVNVLVANTNTSAATINIHGIGAKSIYRDSSTPVVAGDLVANKISTLIYDGTNFIVNSINASFYGEDTSVSANTITVAVDPALSAYTTGYPRIFVKIANTNTGATTIAVNGLASKAVKLPDGNALTGSELYVGMIAEFVYDGTNMQLVNPARILASNAETLAGTNATKFVSPAALASAYVGTGGSDNTYTLPGGLIVKWGISPIVTHGSSQTVTFGTPFPNAVLSWQSTPNAAAVSAGTSAVADLTSIVVYNHEAGLVDYPICWLAIGN